MTTAQDALARLRAGNGRFASGERRSTTDAARRAEIVAGQHPFAVILGCSDSRVPPETIFDAGLGDLFVVRVAGNVVAAEQIESIEYAVTALGAKLVLVLGHSGCGAVAAALEASRLPAGERPAVMPTVIDRILPSIDGVPSGSVVRANVRASVEALRTASPALAPAADVVIAGAEYDLATGLVEFF